jgi:hypothetical protein
LERLWIARDPSLVVAYRFGDSVRITSGERAEEVCRVVALLSVEPSVVYVTEFPDGTSAVVTESDLERAAQL